MSSGLTDEDETVNHLESDWKGLKLLSSDDDNEYCSDEIAINSSHEDLNFYKVFFERDQPIEEPWLLGSSFATIYKDKMTSILSDESGSVEDEVNALSIDDNLLSVEGNLVSKDDSVSTIILINSSICTMQRIAVLEDEKLVELLLEPVKSNVQCDSVYLGVITKLVPHMGGAFVNIGTSRPSLMDIKQNREPFVFPPFRRQRNKRAVNGSVSAALEENQASHDDDYTYHDTQVINDVAEADSMDDLEQFLPNDDEDHDADDDEDASEILDNVNGSIVDYGEVEADFEDLLDGDHHQEGETLNGPFSNDSQVSHPEDTKDSKSRHRNENKWLKVQKGTKVIVQVVKEGMGTKGPTLTPYPKLRSRFWVLFSASAFHLNTLTLLTSTSSLFHSKIYLGLQILITRCDRIGISKKITGVERTRLKVIAKTLQPQGFGLTVRTVAAGHSLEELQKDLDGLLSIWKNIMEHAKSTALAADEGVDGAVPAILHRAMGQTLSVVQDYFNDKVSKIKFQFPFSFLFNFTR